MHPYNPSTQEAGQGYEFEASLDYQVTLLKRKGGREEESREGISCPTWIHLHFH